METTQINRRQPTEIYIHRDADPTISLFFDELDSDKQVQYLEELDAFQADFDRETSTEADKEAIRELESKSDHSAKRFLEERDLWTMKMGLLQKEVDYWKQTSTRSINSLSNCQNKRINAAFNKEQRLKHILYNQDMRAHRRRIDAEERAIHAVQSERVQTNQKLREEFKKKKEASFKQHEDIINCLFDAGYWQRNKDLTNQTSNSRE